MNGVGETRRAPGHSMPRLPAVRGPLLHRLTAIPVAAFAVLHVAIHLAALGGVEAHVNFMRVARLAYRAPLVEPLFLLCVATQVGTGLRLLVRGWARRGGGIRAQALAGGYLAGFLLLHVGAVLLGRGVLHLDTNFYFAAAGLHVSPPRFFFRPYYVLAVVAIAAHLGCAAARRLTPLPSRAGVRLVVGAGGWVAIHSA